MCEVTIYINEKIKENELMKDVSEYEIDFRDNKLTAYPMLGPVSSKGVDFQLDRIDKVNWSERDHSLVIEGKMEE